MSARTPYEDTSVPVERIDIRDEVEAFCEALGFRPKDVVQVHLTPTEAMVVYLKRDGETDRVRIDRTNGEVETGLRFLEVLA